MAQPIRMDRPAPHTMPPGSAHGPPAAVIGRFGKARENCYLLGVIDRPGAPDPLQRARVQPPGCRRDLTTDFTKTRKERKIDLMKESQSMERLVFLAQRAIFEGDGEAIASFVKTGQTASGKPGDVCLWCNKRISARPRAHLDEVTAKVCQICLRWYCEPCCSWSQDLGIFGREAHQNEGSLRRVASSMELECCGSCDSYVGKLKWRLSPPPENLAVSSQRLHNAHPLLAARLTTLAVKFSNFEGHARSLADLLQSVGPPGDDGPDLSESLAELKSQLDESRHVTAKAQAIAEATIQALGQIECTAGGPSRDAMVRDNLVKHGKVELERFKPRLRTVNAIADNVLGAIDAGAMTAARLDDDDFELVEAANTQPLVLRERSSKSFSGPSESARGSSPNTGRPQAASFSAGDAPSHSAATSTFAPPERQARSASPAVDDEAAHVSPARSSSPVAAAAAVKSPGHSSSPGPGGGDASLQPGPASPASRVQRKSSDITNGLSVRERLARKHSQSLAKASSAAASTLEERAGIVVWRVVWNGEVRVRKEKDASATELGFKRTGAEVRGWQEGTWVALADEPGFMMIVKDGMTFLQRADEVARKTSWQVDDVGRKTSLQEPQTQGSPRLGGLFAARGRRNSM